MVPVARAQPADPLKDAIDGLIAEAQVAMTEEAMPVAEPEFASRTETTFDAEALAAAILSPQHEHPFVDAYVRWQLTSLAVDMPELDEAEFFHVLNHLPELLENPRAKESLVSMMERADETGPLSRHDSQHLREAVHAMEWMSATAEAFNVPALELREWISGRFPLNDPRRLLMLVEQCAATVEAGWAPRAIKSHISRTFSSASTNPSLTETERRAVLGELPRLTSLERRLVNTVTFLGDGSVRVRFSTAAITKRDVENWTERLMGSGAP